MTFGPLLAVLLQMLVTLEFELIERPKLRDV